MLHLPRDRERDRLQGAQKEIERKKKGSTWDETNKRETVRKGEAAE